MATAKQFERWNHTAAVMCLTANINRGKKSRGYKVEEFHPMMAATTAMKLTKQTMPMLKCLVPQGRPVKELNIGIQNSESGHYEAERRDNEHAAGG